MVCIDGLDSTWNKKLLTENVLRCNHNLSHVNYEISIKKKADTDEAYAYALLQFQSLEDVQVVIDHLDGELDINGHLTRWKLMDTVFISVFDENITQQHIKNDLIQFDSSLAYVQFELRKITSDDINYY